MSVNLLIVTNGNRESFAALEQGAWLAETLQGKITLLGINEEDNPAAIDDAYPLTEIFEKAVGLFKARGAEYKLEVQNGGAEEIVPKRAREDDSIVVLSPMGRSPIQHWVKGRSIRDFIEAVEQPLFYATKAKIPAQKILISVGGLGYEVSAEDIAMQIAMKRGAELTLLHVVPPIDFNYPTAETVAKNWQTLTETDTPIGRNLRESLEAARTAGVAASVKARQGQIVEEILKEAAEGDYDLLCMGSSYSGMSLRQKYSSNVTSEVMERAPCPVMTARYKRK
ncbi:MAG: universal stress protein [Anaerolineales bacterium]|nr:universal stress protein [Anaerolineales bacterium]